MLQGRVCNHELRLWSPCLAIASDLPLSGISLRHRSLCRLRIHEGWFNWLVRVEASGTTLEGTVASTLNGSTSCKARLMPLLWKRMLRRTFALDCGWWLPLLGTGRGKICDTSTFVQPPLRVLASSSGSCLELSQVVDSRDWPALLCLPRACSSLLLNNFKLVFLAR